MKITSSTEADLAAIADIHKNAFGVEEGVEIAALVQGLFADQSAHPLLSLVAEKRGAVIGHILFTAVTLQADKSLSARILAPLGVACEFQGKGVGGALITEGLRRLTEAGVALVFVLGHPGYYPRFGFQTAGIIGYQPTYPLAPEQHNAWRVRALQADVLGRAKGRVHCARTLSQPQYWQA